MSMTIDEAEVLVHAQISGTDFICIGDKEWITMDGIFTPEQLRFIADTMDKIEEKTR